MKVEFTHQLEKQVEELQNKKLKKEIAIAVKSVIAANALSEIPNLKKLSGFKTAFRIRTGSYRIGILIQDDAVILWCLHIGKIFTKNSHDRYSESICKIIEYRPTG